MGSVRTGKRPWSGYTISPTMYTRCGTTVVSKPREHMTSIIPTPKADA